MNLQERLLQTTDNPTVSYKTLRTLIGVLGLLLPTSMVIYSLGLTPPGFGIERSISAYYHTQMREVLVCILSATGVFMMTYKGYQMRDTIASFLAGLFALGVAFFPTSGVAQYGSNDALYTTVGLYRFVATAGHKLVPGTRTIDVVGYIHNAMAIGLFLTFAIMSLVLFTISSLNSPGPKKRQRNLVYRVCGWTILASVAILISNSFLGFLPESLHSTFWFEALSLFAFGSSWLVKGEAIKWLNDPEPAPTQSQNSPEQFPQGAIAVEVAAG